MKKTLYVLACTLCTLLVLPAAAQVPSYVPTDGLVGWWPFNGNANDESGNGNDGVVIGAIPAIDRFNNLNSAYQFNGIDNYINISYSNSLHGQIGTVNAWIKTNGQLNEQKNIFGQSQGRPQLVAESDNSTTPHKAAIQWKSNTGNFPSAISTSDVDISEWVMITGYYSLDTFKICVNGNQEHFFFTNLQQDNCSQSDYQIGGYITNGSCQGIVGLTQMFSGLIDDIAIYNRALTEQEIQNLYTGTTPPPCVSLPSNLQQGLVGYWPFCGNANDESGNGNDGAVNGATLTEDRFGNANAAFAFDGVDDFIQASVSELPLSNSERTLSIWVNYNSIPNPGEGYYILSYGSYIPFSFEGNSMGISNNTPIITWRYSGYGTQGTYIDTQTEIDLNTWYNLTGVIENGVVKLYVNGVLISEADASGWNTVLTDLFIGRLVSEDDFTHGSLDDIGIWNRALTAEEVQELYTLDACTFTVYDTLTVYETVYDTVYTYETIYDTVTTYVTVTDTLLIDITFVGFEGQPSWLNTVTVFPNPASDHITIDYGNFALMAGYNTIITDAAGATVYSSAVNSQQVEIDINAWGATGVYYMSMYDANGELVAVRHIVLE